MTIMNIDFKASPMSERKCRRYFLKMYITKYIVLYRNMKVETQFLHIFRAAILKFYY